MPGDDKLVDAVAAHTAALLTELAVTHDQVMPLQGQAPTPPPLAETWQRVCEVAISEGDLTLPLKLAGPNEKDRVGLEVCPRCEGTGVVRRGV